MKIKQIIPSLALACCALTAAAQTEITSAHESPKTFWSPLEFGVHTGIDLGAAVPWPLSNIGSDAKMNANPVISPAIGLSATTRFKQHWSLSLEATYKHVGVDAKARVSNQRFRDVDNPDVYLNFKGTTKVDMKFSMLEVPLYAGYSFRCNTNRVIAGVYYSYIMKGRFKATPLKGVLTPIDDDNDWSYVTQDDPMDEQDFSDHLSSWDFGFLVGYEWRLMPRVHVGARFYMGLKDIFKHNKKFLEYNMLHMRGSVIVSYNLFRKQ